MADRDPAAAGSPVPPEGAGDRRASARSGEASSGEVHSVPPTQSAPSTVEEPGTRATVRRSRKQVLLRLDPDVHAAVAKWAADDLRSVNAQIEVLLRRALKDAGRDPHAAPMRGRGRPRSGE